MVKSVRDNPGPSPELLAQQAKAFSDSLPLRILKDVVRAQRLGVHTYFSTKGDGGVQINFVFPAESGSEYSTDEVHIVVGSSEESSSWEYDSFMGNLDAREAHVNEIAARMKLRAEVRAKLTPEERKAVGLE